MRFSSLFLWFDCRYDEFGRVKRKNRGGDDRRSREEAALARLRGRHPKSFTLCVCV